MPLNWALDYAWSVRNQVTDPSPIIPIRFRENGNSKWWEFVAHIAVGSTIGDVPFLVETLDGLACQNLSLQGSDFNDSLSFFIA